MLIFKSKHKLLVLSTIFLMAVHSLNNVFLAVIISNMIDAAVIGSMHSFLVSSGVGLVGFLFFMVIGLLMVKSKTTLMKKLNLSIKEILIKDIIYHSKNTEDYTTELSFMTNDLKQLETKGLEAEITIVQLTFTAIFALIAALYYDVWVTIAFSIGAFVPVLFSMSFQNKIETSSEQWSQSNAMYTNRLKDYFNGIETVRTYQVEDQVISKATEEAEKMEESLKNMNQTVEMLNQYVTTIAMFFSMMMPFGVGVYRMIQHGLTLGAFIAIVQLSNSITNPLLQIMQLVNGYATTSGIRKRYSSAKERTKVKSMNEIPKLVPAFSTIKLENFSVQFKEKTLFSDVNLDIRKNDNILVIGSSGSGKSSLLRIVQQTLPMKEGRYLYNGEECKEGLMHQFSLIRQQPLMFNDTIRYNITLGDDYTDDEVMEAVRSAQLEDVVAEKGLDYLVGENGRHLSGGQLQRIEIARALVRKRPIILADEMTSALDEKTASAVRQALLKIPSTLIEVSHKFTEEDKLKYSEIWDVELF
ncbi:ABC transporter ATP-binding protein [Carnobacteriaceae bacterium 52-44]